METKWTPGPWLVGNPRILGSSEYRMVITANESWADGGPVVVDLAALLGNKEFAKLEANAHLIAAAPELYDALAEDLPPTPDKLARCHVGLVDQSECAHCQRIIRKHKALAKARGEK